MDSPRQTIYVPPRFALNERVAYYPGRERNSPSMSAIITSRPGRLVNLLIFEPDRHKHREVFGVRHIDDPGCENNAYEMGAWDYTSQWKRFLRVEALVLEQAGEAKKDPLPGDTLEDLWSEAYESGMEPNAQWDKIELGTAVLAERQKIGRDRKKKEKADKHPAASS